VSPVRSQRLQAPSEFGAEPDPTVEFSEFIAHVAEANRQRDGSPPGHVARVVLVGVETNGTNGERESALTFNAEPYLRERHWPSEILVGRSSEAEPLPVVDGPPYDLAVAVTRDALRAYYDEHGWDGVVRAEEFESSDRER
jgi:hypothetical protein